jgi:PAS domain S-box-containing protein
MGFSDSAEASIPKHVLVLNSYHCGYAWTDNLMEGIRSVFNQSGVNVDLLVEYMDTKRHPPDKIFPIFKELCKKKYQNEQPDVIIVSDNNALDFIMESRHELFPKVPVVFCGINNFSNELISGQEKITGVAENTDLKSTVELILKLHPGVANIAVISDSTETGKINLNNMRKIMPEFKGMVNFIELADLGVCQLEEKLQNLPKQTILLQLSFFRDCDGKVFSQKESMEMIIENCHLPIYSAWDFYINYGVVGGVVTSGFMQGKNAATMAERVLNGEQIEKIPIMRESPNTPMFDYLMLKKFGISLSDIPEGSMILNQPDYFYNRYKIEIYTGVAILLTLLTIIAALFVNIVRRKQSERLLISYIEQRIINEENLRRSENKYRQLFSTMQTGFALHEIICDDKNNPEDYLFLEVNPAYEIMTGLKAENIVGKTVKEIFPIVESYWIETYSQVALTGKPAKIERYSQEVGRYFDIVAYRPQHGQFATIITDITEKKQLEEQLRQAQKMEAIGTLAGGIAHDFNNILFPIIGYTEMAKDDVKDETTKKNLEEVLKAAKRAKELVKQILTISRRSEHETKPLQIQPIIKETLKFLKASLPQNIMIRQQISDTDCSVLGDPVQIHQVIMNLCTNAYHAMREKGGVLDITLEKIEVSAESVPLPDMTAGTYLKTVVSDTGDGIGEKTMERIFEPYFTTKPKGEGTGLGLAVTAGIIKEHKGYIQVNSKPGEGSAFVFYLPVADVSSSDDIGETTSTDAVSKGNEHILVADDEQAIVRLIKAMLERMGYSVTPKFGSKEALEEFMAHPDKFDLLISDMMMPHLTGVELIEKVKEIRPNIPVILCTGFSDGKISEEKISELGIREIVPKPLHRKELTEAVRRVLDSA